MLESVASIVQAQVVYVRWLNNADGVWTALRSGEVMRIGVAGKERDPVVSPCLQRHLQAVVVGKGSGRSRVYLAKVGELAGVCPGREHKSSIGSAHERGNA